MFMFLPCHLILCMLQYIYLFIDGAHAQYIQNQWYENTTECLTNVEQEFSIHQEKDTSAYPTLFNDTGTACEHANNESLIPHFTVFLYMSTILINNYYEPETSELGST